MRISSLDERREFYSHEFSLTRIRDWFRGWRSPVVFAAVIGRHTGISPMKYRRERARTIVIDEYESLSEMRNYLIDFMPESAYYDRTVYKDWDQARHLENDPTQLGSSFGQELVFDIDPENFACPIHGTLEEKMRRHKDCRSVGWNSNWLNKRQLSSWRFCLEISPRSVSFIRVEDFTPISEMMRPISGAERNV